jgi:Bucentaur or craniofacial development
VDAAWARLSALPIGKPPDPIISQDETPKPDTQKQREPEDEYITIKRITRFAGEVTTEEKRVHKHSAEAKLYQQEQEEKRRKVTETDENVAPEDEDTPKLTLRKPLKRPSRYEPNPAGEVKALPPHLQLRWPRNKAPIASGGTVKTGTIKAISSLQGATKLNTVEKSRHDWVGFVDKEGIAEELDEYGKSKASYLGREEFLKRAENREEDERRDARRKVI